MDKDLQSTLKKRQENCQCIICGRDITEKMQKADETFYLAHFLLGRVEICKRHVY